jgi:hypothetical protein
VKYQTAGKLITVPRRLTIRTYSERVSVWSVITSSIIMRRMWGAFRIFYVGFATPQTLPHRKHGSGTCVRSIGSTF